MAQVSNSVVGLDLGRNAFKSVLIQRRGAGRFQFSRYAVRRIDGPVETSDQIAHEVMLLLKEMGGSAKASVVAISSPDSLIRIIEQPSTPREMLRDALRLNGISLLNQDVKDFMLDCAGIQSSEDKAGTPSTAPSDSSKLKYLVGGLPRGKVEELEKVFQTGNVSLNAIQLAPICIFNAFEFSNVETVKNDAFLLVDIGHVASTVIIGLRKELILVRTLDYGGKDLIDSLLHFGGGNVASIMGMLDEGDFLATETARRSLVALTKEISISIGHFEARHEEIIPKIFVSGGLANSKGVLELLAAEFQMPCEMWNPFSKCEMALQGGQKDGFANDMAGLVAACGAAVGFLKDQSRSAVLYINLYDAIQRQKSRRRRDPFEIGIKLLPLIAVGFLGYYLWLLHGAATAGSDLVRAKMDWKITEPKEKTAMARQDELDQNDRLANALVHRIENRFYWASLLDQILPNVPPDIQITQFQGSMENKGSKEVKLSIEGIATGSNPRAVAEKLRIAFENNLSGRYQQTTSVFRSLEDGAESVQYQGGNSPTAKFVIDLNFISPDINEGISGKTRQPAKK